MKHSHTHAFSLVELSIVLVILGLLIGGILSGQALIRAAELRSITTEYSRYVTATQTFRDKYFALPGDMTNATSFWNAAHATPATCYTTASSTALTCNGDGNGLIYPNAGSNETYRYWQHLANAGLIEGSYDGIEHGANSYSSTTANSPRSKISNGLWFVWHWGTIVGDANLFAGNYDNFFELGQIVADGDPSNPIIKPEEAWNIDTKIDDGKPGLGKLVVRYWSTCTNAATKDDGATAAYLLTSSAVGCTLIFPRVF
jgi:prepilin-type N-terminal cleavage/methylation domain-containing protein